jgi:hypothetical protein
MRISEDRYARDLRRMHLARRFMQHEVRTQWICAWTGLSPERVRNLYKSYLESLDGAVRHRGPSPRSIASFLSSPTLRAEASAAGGLACALGVVPEKPMPNARKCLQTVETGERLCHVYELYRKIVPSSRLTMDQLIVLVIALAEREDFEIVHCGNCHGALLVDRLGSDRRLCRACRQASGSALHEPTARLIGSSGEEIAAPMGEIEAPNVYQQSLF